MTGLSGPISVTLSRNRGEMEKDLTSTDRLVGGDHTDASGGVEPVHDALGNCKPAGA